MTSPAPSPTLLDESCMTFSSLQVLSEAFMEISTMAGNGATKRALGKKIAAARDRLAELPGYAESVVMEALVVRLEQLIESYGPEVEDIRYQITDLGMATHLMISGPLSDGISQTIASYQTNEVRGYVH